MEMVEVEGRNSRSGGPRKSPSEWLISEGLMESLSLMKLRPQRTWQRRE